MSKAQLYKKIHEVMKEVEYLQKDDKVEFGQTKYKAISEEKVTTAVRASLIKNGLIIIPAEQEHSREGTLSTVNVKYKIIDTETGEFEIAVSSGTGADTQDKGVGKAMTYSYKYLLLRTFAIPTGEDPDKISNAELEQKSKAVLKAKWEQLAGNLDEFDKWFKNMINKGNTEQQMNEFLTQKLIEKGVVIDE